MNTSKAAVAALAWDRSCARAALRAEKSSDPDAFLDIFIDGVGRYRATDGSIRHPGCQQFVRSGMSSLQVAAQIEALAAARTLSVLWHEAWCPCTPCVIHRISRVRTNEGERRV